MAFATSGPAWADDALTYNPQGGEDLVKSFTGFLYIGLVGYFLYRTFNKRARAAREERIAGQGPVETPFTKLIQERREAARGKATALTCFLGGAQAAAIATALFVFTSKVDAIVSASELPSGYTAHNVAVTVRTILLGLLYLSTFIFSANAAGLTALSVQMVLFPGSIRDDDEDNVDERRAAAGPQLPKVSVLSSTDDIRRAFDSVAQPPRQDGGSGGSGGGGVAASGAAANGPSSGSSSSSDT